MIEYLLVLHICSNIDGDCTWERMGRFPSEQGCLIAGMGAEPVGTQFKCVMQAVNEPTSDVPLLPAPRPTGQ